MELERAEGIVLRTHPVTESSLIVTWFTREAGKLKTLAKGARRLKGPFRGKLDLFYHDEFLFLPSRRGDLHLLHECFLQNPHKRLRESVPALTAASYITELVELATEREDANARIFEALSAVLEVLERDRAVPAVLSWFEIQVLAAAGWAPRWEGRTGVSKLLASLSVASLAGARRVRLSAEQVSSVRSELWRRWDEHVGRAPRLRSWLSEEKRN